MKDFMDNHLLQKYIEGKVSREEKEEVARWLDADEKNMKDFLLLRTIYDATLWSEIGDIHSIPHVKKRRIKMVYDFLKIAAVFLLLLGGYHLVFYSKQPSQNTLLFTQTVYAPEGQRVEITLTDGTKVWLNAKTSLSFPNHFSNDERKVELDGEAYFDVKKDESRTFIVQTKDYQVNVLGTEFNVKAYHQSEQFEAALIRGSIEIYSGKTDEKIQLSPNHRVYTEDGQLKQSNLTNYNHFLWREGIIAFENESVEDILKKLELYFDISIEVKNKMILTDRYIGKFRTKDGVEHIVRVLQRKYGFKYIKDNESNIITIY